MVRLQPLTRARVRTLGETGARWQQQLPVALDRLAARWGVTPGRALPGGSASYVCAAETTDGRPAVIKIGLPSDPLDGEAALLRRADGRGYCRLLAHAPEENAVLLERLGAALGTNPGGELRGVEEQLRVLADTLARAWLAPGPDEPRAAKAAGLAELIGTSWRADGPCPVAVRDAALAEAAWLDARPADRPVVVHGDPHPHNALRVTEPRPGAETGWVFVDPDGFVDDPCYDLGVTIRDHSARVLAADDPRALVASWAALLAAETAHDADRIRRWAFLERVSTGLYVASFGAARVAEPFLASAARLL
ncbi:streptomycin 6-kinase [Friedmanniella endophytica]|uniref:Streptomycin 6-kinase n=1 Tax=Microlunatus kandeliicorticis TaxID=1759536 RepID=A0A7W3IU26_9ACTN|nr:aminoglycoside phosphotransferase family protein [Microlunatus kandeliicorticis]MBA8795228.1 streptomycin 6-kinase [Microlunatus kandeliicorticis]